jgi:hypothetical protein
MAVLDWFRPSRGVTALRLVFLYYAENWLPQMIVDCYFYSLENRLIDMVGFPISVTIPTNTHPIGTLYWATSYLVGRCTC